jgi:hypothetical protein
MCGERTNEGKGGEGYLEGKATKLNDQSHNTVKEKKRFALRTVKKPFYKVLKEYIEYG